MKIILLEHAQENFLWSRKRAFEIRKTFEDKVRFHQSDITLDFSGVDIVTQSFFDELVGVFVTHEWPDIVKCFHFHGCNEKVKVVIKFVIHERIKSFMKQKAHDWPVEA